MCFAAEAVISDSNCTRQINNFQFYSKYKVYHKLVDGKKIPSICRKWTTHPQSGKQKYMELRNTNFPQKSAAGLYFIKALWLTNISEWTRSVRLGPVRFCSARFGVQCERFHFTTQVCFPSRIGWFRFCSGRLGLLCEWGLRCLFNPCTTRHVFNAYLTENLTCKSDTTKATLSPHDKSDATWRAKSDAERTQWSRLSGWLKRYKQNVR